VGASVDTVKKELEKRFEMIAKRYGDKINTIEVTNEMLWWHSKTSFYNEDDYIEWCFKTARKYFPSNQLVINEATEEGWREVKRITGRYYGYICNTMLRGAPVDAIGLQFHMFYMRQGEADRASSTASSASLQWAGPGMIPAICVRTSPENDIFSAFLKGRLRRPQNSPRQMTSLCSRIPVSS
jgi:GH35 family endo-1,4-beta-xylanase